MSILKYSLIIIIIALTACASSPLEERSVFYQAETYKAYDDVLAELEIAIAEHNFRITGHSRVGKVIRERDNIRFPDYDTLQFCNLTHAKVLLELSPHSVRQMPCNVVIYQFKDKVIINTRLLATDTDNEPLNQFAEKINVMLKAIVDFSAEE